MAQARQEAALARAVVRRCDRATLATAMRNGGEPYASLVLVACDLGGSPVMLLSDLADHTKNLGAAPTVSLLFDGTAGHEEPLTGPRVTLQGRAERTADPALAGRFLARHPGSSLYAGFGDFNFYRVAVSRAHLVAGFGRIHWFDAAEVLMDTSDAAPLAAAEADIVAHMNADHTDAVGLYANVLLDRPGAGWRMTGIDPEGVDLRRAGEPARLAFETPVSDAESARRELVELAKNARKKSGGA